MTDVARINEAGWRVFWAPLPHRNNPLHVRMIPDATLREGRDPTLEEARALSKVFIKAP